MARFILVCFILADALIVSLALANAPSLSNPPALSPSNIQNTAMAAEAPTVRRLGKHHKSKVVSSSDARPLSPSSANRDPEIAKAPVIEVEQPAGKHSTEEHASLNQPALTEPKNQESELAQGPVNRRLAKHHSNDKSIAGGGVILGGLATTFLVSVFCYIRATGRRNEETTA